MAVAPGKSDLILQRIKDLPPLPLVVRKLISVMDDERASADDISAVLTSDQALAAKVLKLVNSSFYGVSREVSTISRAVVILGVSAIRNLALGLSIASIMGKGRQSSLWSQFWDHSLATATCAEYLAKESGYPDPEEAFIAGLLHDIGHLVFMLATPAEFCELMESPQGGILEREEQTLGLTHTKCGQKLLKQWKLPHALEQAVRFHHHGGILSSGDEPLVTIIGMADLMAGPLCGGYDGSPTIQEFTSMLKHTKLEVQELAATYEKVQARLEETRTFLQIALDNEDLAVATSSGSVKDYLEVAVIGTDKGKSVWAQQVLEFWGHEVLPMKTFFTQAAQEEYPDLVLLDAESVSDEHFEKMAPLLRQVLNTVVLLGDEQQDRARKKLGWDLPHLSLGFTHSDLLTFLDEEVLSTS
jgi:putative nucleotidyltransferase with HDIG domain